MRKNWNLAALLAGVMIVMAGCSGGYFNKANEITASSPGIWNHYIVWPLAWFLREVAHIFGGSFGLSIIIATILVRLALLPLMLKQIKSSKAMQDLQPKMKEIRAKYSSKDQQTQRKLQEETMKLFQEHNVNPMSGCLPIVVQMPILIAFYTAIRRTHEIAEQNFLWFNLGQPDPVLPFIAAGLTFIQQKLMMGRTGNANPQMAMMTYVMPIMIAVIGFAVPSALVLYWVIGNLFMIAQTFIIYKPSNIKMSNQTGGSKK